MWGSAAEARRVVWVVEGVPEALSDNNDRSARATHYRRQGNTSRERAMVDRYTVATDGACKGNPGPAGWAWVGEDGHWAFRQYRGISDV